MSADHPQITPRESMAIALYTAHKAQYRPDSLALPEWPLLVASSQAHWLKVADAAIEHTPAPQPILCIVTQTREANKPPEYWVTIGRRGRDNSITPNKYTIRGRAEFDAAEWDHVLNGAPKPNILDFDTDPPPATANDTTPVPVNTAPEATQLRELLQRILDSHKFNVASLVPSDVHGIAYLAMELLDGGAGFDWCTPPGWTNRFRHAGRWDAYPIGTRAHASSGGYWERVVDGWKWSCGSTFPTPGGDALDVSIPCRPSQDVDTLRRCLYVAVGDDAKDWADADGVPVGQILAPAIAGDVASAREHLERYEAKNAAATAEA